MLQSGSRCLAPGISKSIMLHMPTLPSLQVLGNALSPGVQPCLEAVWDLHCKKPEMLDKKRAKSGKWNVQSLLRIGRRGRCRRNGCA